MVIVAGMIAALIMIVQASVYIWRTGYGSARPVFTTWVLFFVASSLSFWTYRSSKKHSLIGNVANLADMFICGAIVIGILIFRSHNLLGNRLDVYCIVISGIILLFWRITEHHDLANILLQIVMATAYLPTFAKLWYATQNTEPLVVWIMSWFVSVLALIPAIDKKEKLSIVYATRGLILVSVVIWLILRI